MVGINQVGLKILSEVAHVIGGWSGVPGSGVEQVVFEVSSTGCGMDGGNCGHRMEFSRTIGCGLALRYVACVKVICASDAPLSVSILRLLRDAST